MKKILTAVLIFIILAVITILITIYLPDNLLSNIPLLKELVTNTTLTVNSPKSKSQIYIDEIDHGTTNQVITDLKEGVYTITLKRVVENENQTFYDPKSFVIELKNNTESIINVEIGPGGLFSGYILYYTDSPKLSEGKGFITITTSPDNSEILLDNKLYATSPVTLREINEGNYILTVKEDGYETQEIPIIVRKGLNLNINVYLFPIPTKIITN